MKINVGDYVRTKKGEIGKIIGYIDEPTDYYFNCYVTTLKTNFTDTYITEYDNNIKTSPNIIDLIEVGDYVNGYPIGEIVDIYITGTGLKKLQFIWEDEDFVSELFENQIKSIVTKEQFESMEYKIGDKE